MQHYLLDGALINVLRFRPRKQALGALKPLTNGLPGTILKEHLLRARECVIDLRRLHIALFLVVNRQH